MILIKSKIYFREILNSEKNLIIVLESHPERKYPLKNAHQDIIQDILHFFIKSGYIKLAYYAVKKLLNNKCYPFDVSLSASTSGNLNVIKLVRPIFGTPDRWDREIVYLLSIERRPDIIDYFIEDKSLYDGLEEKDPAIYQYYCAQEFDEPKPRLKRRSKFSEYLLGYVFYEGRTKKDGYHHSSHVEFEVNDY